MTIASFCLLRQDTVRVETEASYWAFMRRMLVAEYFASVRALYRQVELTAPAEPLRGAGDF